MNSESHIPHSALDNLELADQWILSCYNGLVKEIAELIDNYEIGDAARKLYDFLWGEFCDWYVEISKADLYSDDSKKKEKALGVLFHVLEGTLKLMHPFMPFISEEIWQIISSKLKTQSSKQIQNPKFKFSQKPRCLPCPPVLQQVPSR